MENVEVIINSLKTEQERFEAIKFIINSLDEQERIQTLELITLFLNNE
ncbi:MAG TPA: hypothetical protein V6C58_07600 [Allocoleopsis sp.]